MTLSLGTGGREPCGEGAWRSYLATWLLHWLEAKGRMGRLRQVKPGCPARPGTGKGGRLEGAV